MHKIFVRLKEERERLGMSQQALADACGVGLRSQQNYEKGERSPDAQYLASLADTGADVLYVLTGKRAANAQCSISNRARALLDNYEHSSPEGRSAMDQMGVLLAEQGAHSAKRAGNGK
ncbi:helix-turn-helix transcriptional regulator [Pandoraea sp. SD6-2]|uniref:helix-turn-helix domain-containing protein n=1 Tax=Pandoraea sp. SD6-2 TaxID=1286093 RepID=UPI00055B3D27